MRLFLFILFVLVPIAEIAVFIQVNSIVGLVPTLLGIVVTAVIGAALVRRQGLQVLREASEAAHRNESPVAPLAHGVLILAAGLLLLTPGYVTDTFGFLLLVPTVRSAIGKTLWQWLQNNAQIVTMGGVHATTTNRSTSQGAGPVIDGEAVDVSPDRPDQASPPNPNSPWIGRN